MKSTINTWETRRYTELSRFYKGRFPFKIATTSYIYPDHIVPNVKMLAPYLDEIELLFFESSENSLPPGPDIDTLAIISQEEALSYNVHLPLDCHLGDPNQNVRDYAVTTIQKIIDLTGMLNPSTYTLHLSLKKGERVNETAIIEWQKRVGESIERILATGISPTKISVENLTYPFEWAEEVIKMHGLSVCLDVGHILINSYDIASYAQKYLEDTTIIHLYGARKAHEHKGLNVLGEDRARSIKEVLKGFTGVVSLEVFSFDDLQRSLTCLERWMEGKLYQISPLC